MLERAKGIELVCSLASCRRESLEYQYEKIDYRLVAVTSK
jgi:hypothetical protein